MWIVRCFMLSFVVIKVLDCLLLTEAAYLTLSEVPSNSPMHPTSFASATGELKAFYSDEDSLYAAAQNGNVAFWAVILVVPLVHYAYQYYWWKSWTPSVRKLGDSFSDIISTSFASMLISLIGGVILARIPIDQNILVSACKDFSSWYMSNLEDNPLFTKCLTSCIFTWLADLVAQSLEEILHSEKSIWQTYDKRRGFAFLLDGIVLSGPLLHYAFGFMESMFPTEGEDGSILSSIIHVFLTDYFVDTVYILLSFCLVALVEGEIEDLRSILKTNFCTTVKASWCTSFSLIPIEFICFRYLSVGYRVLGMNMIDIIWQSVVSFYAHRGRKNHSHEKVEDVRLDDTFKSSKAIG